MFKQFALKYEAIFEDEFDATEAENKLEYTTIFNEFCKMFEECIESKF